MRHYRGPIFLPQVANAIGGDEPRSSVQMGQAPRHHFTHQRGANEGAVQYKDSPATRSIRCSEYPRLPNRRPPVQADPPFQPHTKVDQGKFKA